MRRCIGVCCQAEDGIRELVRSRGRGDVYKRQDEQGQPVNKILVEACTDIADELYLGAVVDRGCVFYTFDASAERPSVDFGGPRFIKKKNE